MVNTARRSSVDKKGASPDINGRSKDESCSGGLQLSRDLYSLKMKNGLPISELAKHIPPPVDDSTDYRYLLRHFGLMTSRFFFSLNSNFANVQIDLDNLAQVLGSTSIKVTLPPKCSSPATSGGRSTPTITAPSDDVYHWRNVPWLMMKS